MVHGTRFSCVIVGHHAFTGVDDLLPLRKAIQKVVHRSVRIGRALGLPDERLTSIGKMHTEDRSAIAVIDSWLRGSFNKSQKPYTLHPEEKYQCPSWWNFVWAVAHSTGGDNPAHAMVIAQSYKGRTHQYSRLV